MSGVTTPLAAIEAEQIKNGSGQVYFFGHINFEDVWGETRSAPFAAHVGCSPRRVVPYTKCRKARQGEVGYLTTNTGVPILTRLNRSRISGLRILMQQ